ncbi:type II toxin-antitoxin system VapC family toxin [Novosphingopyxis sp.]|uniref:type II toxin-antitoxin system VapC family toxin n=1 Tax=Novosphingopyxis sp. TaxID=2709690 RepID=UPI003B591DC1
MRLLFDTHLLIWLGTQPDRFPSGLLDEIESTETLFSPISIWEIAIKFAKRRDDFPYDPTVVAQRLLDAGWVELSFEIHHAVAVGALPEIHGDPFDRALVAQAQVEELTLVTADRQLADYPATIRLL